MTKRPWVLVVMISLVAAAAWTWWERGSRDRDERVSVANRVWIERMPANDRDAIDTLLLIDDDDADLAVGLFQRSSVWQGSFEIFTFEREGDQLDLHFPQTGQDETVRARARRCNERGMDYCLELTGASRGVTRYVSKKGWEIGEHDLRAARAHADALVERALGGRR
jgi:hypothetical protein